MCNSLTILITFSSTRPRATARSTGWHSTTTTSPSSGSWINRRNLTTCCSSNSCSELSVVVSHPCVLRAPRRTQDHCMPSSNTFRPKVARTWSKSSSNSRQRGFISIRTSVPRTKSCWGNSTLRVSTRSSWRFYTSFTGLPSRDSERARPWLTFSWRTWAFLPLFASTRGTAQW